VNQRFVNSRVGWLVAGLMCFALNPVRAAETGGVLQPLSVVINEVMYNPAGDRSDLQYVELLNVGSVEMDLAGWSLSKGVGCSFPHGTLLPPGGYLLVCHNLAALKAFYSDPSLQAAANFKGKLSHKGESIFLLDGQSRIRDCVIYADRFPWPAGPDGYGPSMERICPSADGSDPGNWAASSSASGGPHGTPNKRNSVFSEKPLPTISQVVHGKGVAQKSTEVSVEVADDYGVASVTLAWHAHPKGSNGLVTLNRRSGDTHRGVYQGQIPAVEKDHLVRFVIQAKNVDGVERVSPGLNEPRSAYTLSTFINTNGSRLPTLKLLMLGKVERSDSKRRVKALNQAGAPLPRDPGSVWGNAAIYMPPASEEVQVRDFVRVRSRKGGFKVEFHADDPLCEMTGINVIFEASPRWVLAEPLSYELYRLAGIPTPNCWHLNLWMDAKPQGYYLMVEQPNPAFLRRQGKDPDGNLYKLIWYNQGLTGQHERKTNRRGSYDDLVQLVEALNRTSGAEQWEVIQQNFNVDELINYYAVNMCIQNWDGFWNNYYAYHDLSKGGKWEVIPWDEDKTWGDYDGASPQYDWYTMPLTFGMKGDKSPSGGLLSGFFGGNNGPFGGLSWWRPPGFFSGPLLANPEFRRRFMLRLQEMCDKVFVPRVMDPIIDKMESRLENEVRERARIMSQDPSQALSEFHSNIESFHRQVAKRRDFILKNLDIKR
jgi:hypothetical protein